MVSRVPCPHFSACTSHDTAANQAILLIYAAMYLDAHWLVENPLQSLVSVQHFSHGSMGALFLPSCVAAPERLDLQTHPLCGNVFLPACLRNCNMAGYVRSWVRQAHEAGI